MLDEVHWLSDRERGPAWARQLVAKGYLHYRICGAAEAEPLCRAAFAGVRAPGVVVEARERLSRLRCAGAVAGGFGGLPEGVVALVAFSRDAVLGLACRVQAAGRRCVCLYGAMPASSRLEQIRLLSR